jgi:hypothetical protein
MEKKKKEKEKEKQEPVQESVLLPLPSPSSAEGVAQLTFQRLLNTTHQGVPSSGTDQQLNQRPGAF